MLTLPRSCWLHKCLPTFHTVVLLDLKGQVLECDFIFLQELRIYWTYPLVSLYVYFQLLALSELFWTHGTLVILDIEMDLLMRFQNVLVKKAFATALKQTFELSLRCVLHKVALQVVLVTAPVIRKCFRRNI